MNYVQQLKNQNLGITNTSGVDCGGAVALYSLCCIICNKTASLALNVRKKVAFEVKQNIFTLLVDMESLYWPWSKGFVFLREIRHERI